MDEVNAGAVRWGRFRSRLAAKLAVCLVVSATVLSGVFGYFTLRTERRHSEQQLIASADRISDIILRSAQDMMLRNDREQLYNLIRNIGGEPGIHLVRIFNREGTISYSTIPGEVHTMVDKRSEQCYVCHSQSAPLTRLARKDRARIFTVAHGHPGEGRRVLAMIRPVENQPSCWNAACHAHPENQRILGVIDTHLEMSSVDAAIGERQRQLLFSAAATGVMLCVLSLVFIWVVVDRPIRDLMRGTRKVSAGDLGYRLPERSSDELGDLARAFNRMTGALERANAELTEWGKTLERRVRSKSEELERAHSTLVAAEKMASLGRLAATVAHEVNNPLFGMLTYARLTMKAVNKAPLDDAAREGMLENLRVIERESKRCGELMQNLLTFARQSPPQRAPVDVNVLVERAAGLVRHQMELQEIALELDLDRGLPPVSCDPSQIQQVLLVLFVNACEAMPEGGLVRAVTAADPERDVVAIRVKDNGPGIAPETITQIFEPFFTTKDNQHRTGLGLAIARNIIDRHAGSLEVFSQPGKGAEFVITLPLEAAGGAPGPAGLVLETRKEG